MNLNHFFNKVYNIAFRLTGDESKAADMSYVAIRRTMSGFKLPDNISDAMFLKTAKEVCGLFLSEYNHSNQQGFEQNNFEAETFQRALMALSPISRATIVWRDVLGFKIDVIAEGEYSKQELYRELNHARRQIKEQLNVTYQN